MSDYYYDRLGGLETAELDEGKSLALKDAALDVINSHFPEEQKQLWLLELSEIAEAEGLDSTYVDLLYERLEGVRNG